MKIILNFFVLSLLILISVFLFFAFVLQASKDVDELNNTSIKNPQIVTEDDLFNNNLLGDIPKVIDLEEVSCIVLDDFDAVGDWRTVNDDVMGGRSLGSFTVEDSMLLHRGSINTNGGGFSSVRRLLSENVLVGYREAIIRLDTDGRAYAVQFEDARYRNVSHRYTIEATEESGWREVSFELQDTVPVSFGVEVDAESFLTSAVDSLRLSLNDGIDGPFDIAVDWIKVCQ